MDIHWGRTAGLAAVAAVAVPIVFASAAHADGGPAARYTHGVDSVVDNWLTASVDAIHAAIAETLRSLDEPEGTILDDGVRVRAEPVAGEVRDTMGRGSRVVVLCERRVPGGHYWGMIVTRDPAVDDDPAAGFGWVRGDLYDVPGRTAARPRPC